MKVIISITRITGSDRYKNGRKSNLRLISYPSNSSCFHPIGCRITVFSFSGAVRRKSLR